MRNFLSFLGFRLGWLSATNDGLCLLLWILTGLMLVFSIFYGPGEPLLTRTASQQISELAKIDRQNTYDNSWWDADKSLAKTSWSEPAQAAKKTRDKSWWPWIITILLFITSVIYTPIAKREEALAAGKDAWNYISAKTETEDIKMKPKEGEVKQQVSIVEKISQQVGWKRLLSFEMLSQFAGDFVRRWLFRKR